MWRSRGKDDMVVAVVGCEDSIHALPEMAARVAAGKAGDSQGADGLLSPRGVSKS